MAAKKIAEVRELVLAALSNVKGSELLSEINITSLTGIFPPVLSEEMWLAQVNLAIEDARKRKSSKQSVEAAAAEQHNLEMKARLEELLERKEFRMPNGIVFKKDYVNPTTVNSKLKIEKTSAILNYYLPVVAEKLEDYAEIIQLAEDTAMKTVDVYDMVTLYVHKK